MTPQLTIFDFMSRYPGGMPGFKEKSGTSQEAAEKIQNKAGLIREKVVRALKVHGPRTADELADLIGEGILGTRPRLSELKEIGVVRKTDLKRRNADGNNQVVWELVPVVGA